MDYASRLPTRLSTTADSPSRLPRRSRSGTVSAPVDAAARGSSFGMEAGAGALEASARSEGGFPSGVYGAGEQQREESPMNGHEKRASVGTQTSRGTSPASSAFGRVEQQRHEAYQSLALRQLEREGAAQVGERRKRLKKWLILIVPPDILPHSPPPLETSAFANGYGASGRYSGGILLPLQQTLSAQVSLVAREFALPSIAGVSLYLCLPGAPPQPAALPYPTDSGYPSPSSAQPPAQPVAGFKPRLTDEAWMACFADYFDPDAHVEAMSGVGILPIAARIEVDIDPRRARWLPSWTALPAASPTAIQSIAPRSPAFENPTPGRPRFGTSLSYNRPFTPSSASEGHLSELQTTDEEGETPPPSEAEETAQYPPSRQHSISSAGPQTSTPRNGFSAAPRPLSLLSAQSTVYRSQPSSPRLDSFSRSSSPLRLPDEPEPVVRSFQQQQQQVVEKAVLEDSGFAEGWKGDKEEWQSREVDEGEGNTASLSATPTQIVTPPTAEQSVTVEDDGHVFAFPRPQPRDFAARPPTPLLFSSPPAEEEERASEPDMPEDAGAEQHERSTEDWTAQLDRLREASKTTLVEGVEHPSEFGSFDATTSIGELLRDIEVEGHGEEREQQRVVEEDFPSSLYPPRGLYGQPQPGVVLPQPAPPRSPTTRILKTLDTAGPPAPTAPALSPSAPGYPYNLACLYPPLHDPVFHLLKLVPIVPIPPRHVYNLSPTLPSTYPILQLYPPVYPDLTIYPPFSSTMALSSSLSTSLRRSPRPPPLPLSPVEAAYHAMVDSWPPTPPSPERQPSATLEDRLCHSGEVDFEPFERQLEEEAVEKAEPAAAVEVGFERRGSLVEADWAMMRSGMRSLEEASQPSPLPLPGEATPEDVEAESEDEFPLQRRESTASLALVEDDPFKPVHSHSGEWTSDSEEGGAGSDDDHDDFLASYGVGRPLSAIVEESETDTTAVSVAVAGPSGDRGFFGGLAGASSEEEGDEAEEDGQHSPPVLSVEPQGSPQLPAMSFHPPFEPPKIIYSAATATPSPSSSRYSDDADLVPHSPPRSPLSNSPLPSPTITPSRQYGPVDESDARMRSFSPTRQLEEEDEDDFAPVSPTTSTRLQYSTSTRMTQEEDDYTLEIDDTHTSSFGGHGEHGGDDEPYVLSPGLQRALGLDNSPELAPVRFAGDDDEDVEMSDDGSEGSQYVVREEESCQTFDHLSPLPPVATPEPVLFVFPPTDQSSDMVDAIAQFVCEAQTQSVERRGKFLVALSGFAPLPELLSEALVSDERIEFDKWEVFFTEETLVSSPPAAATDDAAPAHPATSTLSAYCSPFLSRVPIPSHRVHILKTSLLDPPSPTGLAGGAGAGVGGGRGGHPVGEVCPHVAEKVAREYEAQVLRAFGMEVGETPRFDLVLLGIGEDGSCAGLRPQSPLLDDLHLPSSLPSALIAPVLDSSTSSLTFTLPLLSSARRLAFLCCSPPASAPSAAYAASLANVLDPSIPPESARKVPAGKVRLGGGQPVIVFADEEAARGVPEGEGRRMRFWDAGEEEEDENEGGEGPERSSRR
ncbi:hypothetical protein JCM6882_000990 [Rhodosporidiobolus microsporus]